MKKLLGLTLAIALGIGGAAWAAATEPPATVVRVIDGDTFVARLGMREVTVRLLNFDAPEATDQTKPPECLGPEATAFLRGLLPAGAAIELRYDTAREDRYGRTLAAVYRGETLVNAEVARAGFGAAVVFEPNRRYLDAVKRAQEVARHANAGLYDPARECTLPAQLDRTLLRLSLTSQSATTTAEASQSIADASAALADGEAFGTLLDDVSAGRHPLLLAAHGPDIAQFRFALARALEGARGVRDSRQAERDRMISEEMALEDARIQKALEVELARLAEEARRDEEALLAEANAEAAREEAAAQAQSSAAEPTRRPSPKPTSAATSAPTIQPTSAAPTRKHTPRPTRTRGPWND